MPIAIKTNLRPVQLKLNFHFARAAREFKLLEAISEAVPTANAY
jgi:hypothetical protein